MKKATYPKFKKGELVTCNLVENVKFLTVNDSNWNGFTNMYSFNETEMRCGEDYLKPYTQEK